MKVISVGISLLLLIVSITSPFITCRAETSLLIIKVTPIDFFGNTSYFIDRGFPFSINIELISSSEKDYILSVSSYDTNNVPVGITTTMIHVFAGTSNYTVKLSVTNYAYIGIGALYVSVSELDHSPIASKDQAIFINLLGDFDKDDHVQANDLAFFLTGYSLYWQALSIEPKYQQCDFNKDSRLDCSDIVALVLSYNDYWACVSQ